MEQLIFTNARVIFPDSVQEGLRVSVKDGIIESVQPDAGQSAIPKDARVIDCGGKYLSPGLIDTHCHGGGGADFMDGRPQDIITAARTHLKHGTTGLCPTTLACSDDELFCFFDCYEQAKECRKQMPHLLGIHLEGPYFSAAQAGAQPPQYMRSPSPQHYQKILERGGRNIVKWSIAPELPGAMELGCLLAKRGIIALMGHSEARLETAKEAIRHGFSQLTHFYSGMSSIVREKGHRKLGLVEAGYLCDELNLEVIADGVHLPPELLKLILKCKDHDHICLITDSMRGAGMPDGPSILGSRANGFTVIIQDGIANMPSFDSFAGSVATTDRLVRTMVQKAGLPVWEAVKMASFNPAAFLGIDDTYGSIAPGKSADLLIFDDDITVSSVYVSGRQVAGSRL